MTKRPAHRPREGDEPRDVVISGAVSTTTADALDAAVAALTEETGRRWSRSRAVDVAVREWLERHEGKPLPR